MKTIITLTIGLVFAIGSVSYKNNLQEDLKKYIVGTWVPEEDGFDHRWVFSIDGKCTEYSSGKISDVYIYTLTTSKSNDGTLTFQILTLKSISNPKLEFVYVVHRYSDNKLGLEYSLNPGSYLSFDKMK